MGILGKKHPGHDLHVRVKDGYDPDLLVARAGQPVRITFHRSESSPCSEEVVFPAFQARAHLPEDEAVTLELPPAQAGEYEFCCGMGVLRGRLLLTGGAEGDALRHASAAAKGER